ncbi:Pimeloyl-ACP methyl ester carboxylesterase [Mesorhizobium albiziae]|uniref:Pimeloyl-ACP methyl ester carboxylesterase n=1 Tax=Neomesorhizobium albiziae TaxID=335020 RepID=A0A1I4DY76_9HYPH|nr:alpha/beta hydrolase [Mesorhizobium albiziae]GLS31171.1 oxidoreductase [Mesorhizobium albiziae]SFK98514.1 Pimeloyl-ACP methyl ester carboxylesterase [Mesorhizobium albiziae]
MLKMICAAVAVTVGLSVAVPAAVAQPAKKGYADVNGLKMHYEVHGSGRPVMVLHGAYMSTESMKPMIDGLAKTRQVIAMDLQAHGRTADIDRPITYEAMADDVDALMEELGVAQADIFGYSMGGTLAYQLAIRHPERVRRLAAASGTYKTAGMYPELVAMIGQMTPEVFAGSPMEAEYKKLAPQPENFSKLVAKLVKLDTTPQDWPADAIKAIKAPTLVISTDADVIQPEHSVEIFRLRGGGHSPDFMSAGTTELAILPGTSHMAVMERTDILVPMVTNFFDKEVK